MKALWAYLNDHFGGLGGSEGSFGDVWGPPGEVLETLGGILTIKKGESWKRRRKRRRRGNRRWRTRWTRTRTRRGRLERQNDGMKRTGKTSEIMDPQNI